MLIRGQRHLVTVLLPLCVLITIVTIYIVSDRKFESPGYLQKWTGKTSTSSGGHDDEAQEALQVADPTNDTTLAPISPIPETHYEIRSSITKDGAYFKIRFGEEMAMNPNIIPHPTRSDTWIIVAQAYRKPGKKSVFCTELVCDATFEDGALQCLKPPMNLPIAATNSGNCTGKIKHFNLNIGPHDARVFYSPQKPYIIYGSQSTYSCFGQWMQDFRLLVDWPKPPFTNISFRHATDLQRPPPYSAIEKNWFLFWDTSGDSYVHYDVAPRRIFARLNTDGSVGEDLAPAAGPRDDVCLQKHMPSVSPSLPESIHQATNSLSVTLCNRNEPGCNFADTYVFTIIQHKSYYSFHSVYEPYVMLFKQDAPFELHGISSKPFWIRGRGTAGEKRPSYVAVDAPWNQTEMFYVTSMSWKDQGQNYHGYLDDELFIAFGIEDSGTAGIDLKAADLLVGLALCDEV